MTISSLQERVIQILADQLSLEPGDLQPTTRLAEDLKMDDLDKMELVLDLEEQFETEISDDDAETFTTVQSLLDYLSRTIPV